MGYAPFVPRYGFEDAYPRTYVEVSPSGPWYSEEQPAVYWQQEMAAAQRREAAEVRLLESELHAARTSPLAAWLRGPVTCIEHEVVRRRYAAKVQELQHQLVEAQRRFAAAAAGTPPPMPPAVAWGPPQVNEPAEVVAPSDVVVERRRQFGDRLLRLWVEDVPFRGGARVHAMDTTSFVRSVAEFSDMDIQVMFDSWWQRLARSRQAALADGDPLREFLLCLLDASYFELDGIGQLQLRVPAAVPPLPPVPDKELIEILSYKASSHSSAEPLTKEWIARSWVGRPRDYPKGSPDGASRQEQVLQGCRNKQLAHRDARHTRQSLAAAVPEVHKARRGLGHPPLGPPRRGVQLAQAHLVLFQDGACQTHLQRAPSLTTQANGRALASLQCREASVFGILCKNVKRLTFLIGSPRRRKALSRRQKGKRRRQFRMRRARQHRTRRSQHMRRQRSQHVLPTQRIRAISVAGRHRQRSTNTSGWLSRKKISSTRTLRVRTWIARFLLPAALGTHRLRRRSALSASHTRQRPPRQSGTTVHGGPPLPRCTSTSASNAAKTRRTFTMTWSRAWRRAPISPGRRMLPLLTSPLRMLENSRLHHKVWMCGFIRRAAVRHSMATLNSWHPEDRLHPA